MVNAVLFWVVISNWFPAAALVVTEVQAVGAIRASTNPLPISW